MHRKKAERKGLCGVDPLLVPRKIPKGFMNRPFLCGFCAASEVSELREKQSKDPEQSLITGELSSLFNADSKGQYGRRDNARIFGVEKEADEVVYQKVVDVAFKLRHQISKTDINICHRKPNKNLKKKLRPIIEKLVRRQTKRGLMAYKQLLKDGEEKIFINDDITLLRARLAKALRLRANIKSVVMLYEKVVSYKTAESKNTFENLFKLYE